VVVVEHVLVIKVFVFLMSANVRTSNIYGALAVSNFTVKIRAYSEIKQVHCYVLSRIRCLRFFVCHFN
jgi:hypothetical protein